MMVVTGYGVMEDPLFSFYCAQQRCKQASIMIEWTLNDLTLNANGNRNRKKQLMKTHKTTFSLFLLNSFFFELFKRKNGNQ